MDRTLVGALVAVLLVLVAGFIVLDARGVPTTEYLLFLSGPVVSSIVGAVLAQRTSRIQTVVQKVEHQTNHLLTARLDRIDGELNATPFYRADDPAAGRKPQTPDGIDPQL